MKDQIRVLGIDDAYFTRQQNEVLLVATLMRKGYLDAVLSTHVERDGIDATDKIIEMISNSRFSSQVNYIMTQGTVVAGLNPINIKKLSETLSIPVVSVLRGKPDKEKFMKAVSKTNNKEEVVKSIEDNGSISYYNNVYYYLCGLSNEEAESLIRNTVLKGNIPEPIRMAHIIASGVSKGESTKRV